MEKDQTKIFEDISGNKVLVDLTPIKVGDKVVILSDEKNNILLSGKEKHTIYPLKAIIEQVSNIRNDRVYLNGWGGTWAKDLVYKFIKVV